MRKQIVVVTLAVLAAASAQAQATDMFDLAKTGTPQQIQAAIDSGADLKVRAKDGATPLMCAAQYNWNPEVILTLVKAGADIKVLGKDGFTALMFAAGFNQTPK